MNYKKRYLVYIAIVLILIFVVYGYLQFTTTTFISPDENVNAFFSNLYASTGSLLYTPQIANISSYAHPRLMKYNGEGYVSSKFLGMMLIWGSLDVTISKQISLLIIPLLAILSCLGVYSITKKFDKKLSIISMLALVVLPVFAYWSSMYLYEDLGGLFFAIWSIVFILKERNDSLRNIIFSGFFLGISVLIKPFYAALIPFFLIYIIMKDYDKNLSVHNFRDILVFILVLCLSSLPLFILNYLLYGSPLKTGFNLQYGISSTIVQPNISQNLLANSSNQLFYFVTISPILLLGLLFLLQSIKNFKFIKKIYKKDILIFLGVIAIGIYLSLISNFGGSLQSSYIRYELIPILLLFVLALAYLTKYFNKKIAVIILFLFILSSIIIYSSNISYQVNTRDKYSLYLESGFLSFSDNLTNKSLVLTDYWDKILFPKTQVEDITPFSNNESGLAAEISKLYKNGYEVYFLNSNNINLTNLTMYLDKYNLNISLYNTYIYKISKK